ncbi:TerC/Alx family metal homeostasis membrane protein [candidate division FCPU426 bacterium]|nr:TerC/Alx family metal homeostasis membrane protein [candidate division FCPU426 bacterium]
MSIWLWVGFLVFIIFMLGLDLGVLHKKDHVISIPEALTWTGFWILLALGFNLAVYFMYQNHWLGIGIAIGHELTGIQAALQFFTGYLVEKSLSLDNIFVIALIFSHFRIPLQYQHRVLYWGIFGAILLRGIMIAGGTALMHHLNWMTYVFGALLLATAVRLLVIRHDNIKPEKNWLVKWVRRAYPYQAEYEGRQFFVKTGEGMVMTPLLLALMMVESMDVVFAVDSIPAILGITQDTFIVFTSNIFAILGLRSMYFALAAMLEKFRYLKISLVFLLAFIGAKMMVSHYWHIPTPAALAVVIGILGIGIVASLGGGPKDPVPLRSPLTSESSALWRLTYKGIKRIIILVIGGTILIGGLVLLVLPGPGVLVITIGLAILATEVAWARLLLRRFKSEAGAYAGKLKKWLEKQ